MKNTSSKSNGSGKSSAKSKMQSDPTSGLQELFLNELKDIYWAEKALTKALPKMIKKATSEELQQGLQEHLSVTENQVTRLEEVFELLQKKAEGKKCEAMAGLIKEADEIMQESEEGMVRDAGIISAAQKVEHYEIASYGTLRSLASTLGHEDVADLLEETLNEEKEADEALTQLAESSINAEAAAE
ncbi:MAG TPA: ferritin-like domain-containing protein [Bacteroidia bacterium]|nr:ferritin-like domain-containing protein [Bacteroidia bacterium]